MSPAAAMEVFGLFALFFLLGAVALSARLTPLADEVDDAVRGGRDASDAASRCQERTQRLVALLWSIGSVLYALAGMLLVMRTALGFAYFLVSALIAAFPSVVWAYAGGKHMLIKHTVSAAGLRYTGREFPLGRKIAIIFIGTVLISFVALIELTASKVSIALEQLAIASASERFQRLQDTTNLAAQIDPSIVDDLRVYVPAGFTIHLITRDGKVRSSGDETLTPEEVTRTRPTGTADSPATSSPHVARFARLKNGSILVLQVPWEPYKDIPQRITVYVVVVALFTTLAFIGAAVFLSRDVGRPVQRLRAFAAEMA